MHTQENLTLFGISISTLTCFIALNQSLDLKSNFTYGPDLHKGMAGILLGKKWKIRLINFEEAWKILVSSNSKRQE